MPDSQGPFTITGKGSAQIQILPRVWFPTFQHRIVEYPSGEEENVGSEEELPKSSQEILVWQKIWTQKKVPKRKVIGGVKHNRKVNK